VAAAPHPLASREALSLADLVPWPLALHNQGVTMRQLFDIECILEGIKFEPVFVSSFRVTLQSFARRTDTMTLTRYVTVRSGLAADKLAAVPPSNPEFYQLTLQIQTMARSGCEPARMVSQRRAD
jgi:DNA-binding transcriptional LysR family regulator